MRNWKQKLNAGLFLLLFLFFGQYNLSAQNQDSLVQVLSVAKHDTQRIKTLLLLSEVCDRNDILKYAEPAKKLCEKAIANNIEPKKFYLSSLGNAVNNIGYYYSKIDYFEKALENYKAALKIHEQTNDMQLAAYDLNNIAFVYDNLGNVPIALEYFYKNLKVQENIKDTIGIAYTLNNIGYAFMIQKNYSKAIDYFNKSFKMFNVIHYKKGMAMVYGNFGVIYNSLKNNNASLAYHQKALQLYEEIQDDYSISLELGNIGHVYYGLGNDSAALRCLNRSLEIAEKIKVNLLISQTKYEIANVFFRKGNIDAALEYSLNALELAKETGRPMEIQKPSELLKNIYAKKGNYKDAFEMYQLEIKMKDSIQNETNRKATLTNSLQYEYDKKALQLEVNNEKKIAKKNMLIYSILFLATIIAFISFFFIRQNKLQTKLERMELEQQQYRAQMNPHFIFNCLNSIQHYIVHNDVISANKYLSEFASLMRKTLENNQLHAIELQHEIEYLKSYLTLEQMRFENKFTYEISCAPSVNIFDTQILPMIIQPFAENAIVHGLCYLEGNGKLSIFFEKQNTDLICKIDDNGIGRQASHAIKKQSSKAHVSQGVEMIQKRLALVSTITNRKFNVEIVDKKDETGKATGTLVILKFPVDI